MPDSLVISLGEALVDRLGAPGADPAAAAGPWEDRLGGAPANLACALARLGTPAALASRLGRDGIGIAFAELLAARGVSQQLLQWDPQRPSRIVLVRRDRQGERQFQGFAGDAATLGFADQALDADQLGSALGPLLPQARWLVLGTIPLASAAAAQAAWRAVRLAAAAGVAIAVDVNWRPTFWDPCADPAAGPSAAQRQRILPLLQQARVLKCAAEEAHWLFGSSDPLRVSAALPQHPLVVVSDGANPVRWATAMAGGATPLALPAFATPVVDTTGAGDAFLAGLLHSLCGLERSALPRLLARPEELVAPLRFASACGALVCQGAGAIDPQPTAQQVASFLATHAPGPCVP
jgi:fructokinase